MNNGGHSRNNLRSIKQRLLPNTISNCGRYATTEQFGVECHRPEVIPIVRKNPAVSQQGTSAILRGGKIRQVSLRLGFHANHYPGRSRVDERCSIWEREGSFGIGIASLVHRVVFPNRGQTGRLR